MNQADETDDTDRRVNKARRSDDRPGEGGFRFNKNIDLGHVVSIIIMLGLLMAQWNMMDKRVVVLEEARSAQRERDQAQDILTKEKFQEVRAALEALTRSMEKLSDTLAQAGLGRP